MLTSRAKHICKNVTTETFIKENLQFYQNLITILALLAVIEYARRYYQLNKRYHNLVQTFAQIIVLT